MSQFYVTDELIHEGKIVPRGEKVELTPDQAEPLLESGKVSKKAPKADADATFQERAEEITQEIGEVPTEELEAANALIGEELTARGVVLAGENAGDPVTIDSFSDDDLKAEYEKRELAPAPDIDAFEDEELLEAVKERDLAGDLQTPLDYNDFSKADLEGLATARKLEVKGSGKNDAVTKDDLVKALADNDLDNG